MVRVTLRAPSVADELIFKTAVAVVDELTVKEVTVMPAPNEAVVVP